jgi:hypothetical protein
MPGKLVSDKDQNVLKQVIAWWRSRRGKSVSPDVDEDLESHQAPEVYVAYTGTKGVPGRLDLTPGSQFCEIYEKLDDDFLSPVDGLGFVVYNLGTDDILPEQYVVVERDKYGTWFVGGGGGGGGVSVSGCPKDPQDENTGTDAGCLEFECEEKLVPLVHVMRFKPGNFVVKNESAGDLSEMSGTGSGTGTGGDGVFIKLGGMDVDIEYVRKAFFCVEDCEVHELHGVICVRDGLIMDHYFVADECETCEECFGTGTAAGP